MNAKDLEKTIEVWCAALKSKAESIAKVADKTNGLEIILRITPDEVSTMTIKVDEHLHVDFTSDGHTSFNK